MMIGIYLNDYKTILNNYDINKCWVKLMNYFLIIVLKNSKRNSKYFLFLSIYNQYFKNWLFFIVVALLCKLYSRISKKCIRAVLLNQNKICRLQQEGRSLVLI